MLPRRRSTLTARVRRGRDSTGQASQYRHAWTTVRIAPTVMTTTRISCCGKTRASRPPSRPRISAPPIMASAWGQATMPWTMKTTTGTRPVRPESRFLERALRGHEQQTRAGQAAEHAHREQAREGAIRAQAPEICDGARDVAGRHRPRWTRSPRWRAVPPPSTRGDRAGAADHRGDDTTRDARPEQHETRRDVQDGCGRPQAMPPAPRRSTRPGSTPVCCPESTATTPFTTTVPMPPA